MPRKRTDQWTGGAGATDYKTHPDDAEDAVSDDRKFSQAREGRFSGSQPIPPKVLEPETEQARDEEMAEFVEEHDHRQHEQERDDVAGKPAAQRAQTRKKIRPHVSPAPTPATSDVKLLGCLCGNFGQEVLC